MFLWCCSYPEPWQMAVFVLQSLALSVSCVFFVPQFIFICSACQCQALLTKLAHFLEPQKGTHLLFIILLNFTLHMSSCVIIALLYVFNWKFLFLVAINCPFVALGNNLCISVKALCLHHCLCYPW